MTDDTAAGDELDELIHEATKDPVVAAAFEAAEARRKETASDAQICPQCLHGWHGRRVCRDANCCSCRLTWRGRTYTHRFASVRKNLSTGKGVRREG